MISDLKSIQHALALAHARNFARAAEAVGVAQPTLSRSIASLERELGVRLFDRLTTGVAPTAFGRLLVERGQRLLGDVALLKREIDRLAGLQSGTLAVATGVYASEPILGRAAARLLALYPALELNLESMIPDDVVSSVLAGKIDVGIVSKQRINDEPNVLVRELNPHTVHFISGPQHPLCRKRRLELEEILRYPIVSGPMIGEMAKLAHRHGADGRFDEATGAFRPRALVNSIRLAQELACNSDSIFPATLSMVRDQLENGRLVRLKADPWPLQIQPCAFYRRGPSPSPASEAFMGILHEVDAEAARTEETWRGRRRRGPAKRSK